jgi:hypothetical protein
MTALLHAGAKLRCLVCAYEIVLDNGKASGKSVLIDGKASVLKSDLTGLDLSGCKNGQAKCSKVGSVLLGDMTSLRPAEGEAVSDALMIVAPPSGMLRFAGYDEEPARALRMGGGASSGRALPASSAAVSPTPTQAVAVVGKSRSSAGNGATDSEAPPKKKRLLVRKTPKPCARPYWDWVFVGAAGGDMTLPLPLAHCVDLQRLISNVEYQRKRLRANPERAIEDEWQSFRRKREQFLDRMRRADQAFASAELHLTVSALGFVLDALILVLGFFVLTPVGFATLMAASILIGPAKLGLQLFLKLDEPAPLIVGYSGNRVLMFTDLVFSGGPGLPGAGDRVSAKIGPVAKYAAIIWSLRDAVADGVETYSAWHKAAAARELLREIDREIAPLASEGGQAAWLRQREEALLRLERMISRYAQETQAADCAFSDQPPRAGKLP